MQSSSSLHHVDTRIGSIAVHDDGEGAPILLWPSVFMDAEMFEAQRKSLSGRYRVLAVDPPGHGKSDDAVEHLSLKTCGDVVADIFDALGVSSGVVAGNSWGGMVTIAFAANYPTRCRAAIIMNSTARSASLFDRLQYSLLAPIAGRVGFVPPMRGMAINGFLGATSRRERPELVVFIKKKLAQMKPGNIAATVRNVLIERENQSGRLADINSPTLIIGGAEDTIFPPRHSRHLHRRIVDSRLVMMERIGHFAPLEASEQVNDEILRFLTKLDREEPRE